MTFFHFGGALRGWRAGGAPKGRGAGGEPCPAGWGGGAQVSEQLSSHPPPPRRCSGAAVGKVRKEAFATLHRGRMVLKK